MSRRLQENASFPQEVRDLAAEANLPIPSWHVGGLYENSPQEVGDAEGYQGEYSQEKASGDIQMLRSLAQKIRAFLHER